MYCFYIADHYILAEKNRTSNFLTVSSVDFFNVFKNEISNIENSFLF